MLTLDHLTKKREQREGLEACWRLYLNGKRTALFIEKARERPHWGQAQEYDLSHDVAGFITEGSVGGLQRTVLDILNGCLSPGEG